MKEIFQRKLFWAILVILLLAVFIYPPFMVPSVEEIALHYPVRKWAWIFSNPPPHKRDTSISMSLDEIIHPRPIMNKLDFEMILAESIIAILISIGTCLIPFKKGNKKRD